jgi:hypothetical protein
MTFLIYRQTPYVATKMQRWFVVCNVVPKVGLEPTRGVNPNGF